MIGFICIMSLLIFAYITRSKSITQILNETSWVKPYITGTIAIALFLLASGLFEAKPFLATVVMIISLLFFALSGKQMQFD